MQQNRAQTEQRLIEAVGQIIQEKGIDEVGINRVAQRSGVHKVLIYRYFGNLEGLIGAYIKRAKPAEASPMLDLTSIGEASLEDIYQTACEYMIKEFWLLRQNTETREFLRKSLFEPDAIPNPFNAERDKQSTDLIDGLSQLIGTPHARGFAAIVSSGMIMMTFLVESRKEMLGLDLSSQVAWSEIEAALRQMFRGAYLTTQERLQKASAKPTTDTSPTSPSETR